LVASEAAIIGDFVPPFDGAIGVPFLMSTPIGHQFT